MSSTDRQNRLLVAEDWKRIYQSYKNADFQSYDFDNLRRIMITYIRENYPEDFNDYIESSEYLSLIDLMAFMGQSLAFRTDLNARENFLELADRRESVLRLARLLSYNPKRNIAASGLLKFVSVQTSQTVYDSNGRNIAGQTILWNDNSNQNWYDQFIRVINAALNTNSQIGNPDDKGDIYGIPTEQYRIQANNTNVPVYPFAKVVEGRNLNFEIVSTTFKDSDDIYEEPPVKGNHLAFLYRDDGKGYGSNNTGFFVHFKQGSLGSGNFTLSQPSTNESVDIDTTNINDNDVWLYKLDDAGNEVELWTQTPSLKGNNVIYNSLNKKIKNIYNISTRLNDRISLLFSDGTFGNLPKGTFRVYYRSSNGTSYTINPKDMRNVTVTIPYISNTNQLESLVVNLSLVSSVTNSAESETSVSIKSNAPATYYTQNRMITGEDYNISPLSSTQNVLKIKSINRSSSGISRYFDLVDPTGKYSKTNIFSDDGAIYKEEFNDSFKFTFNSKTEIEAIINNKITDILKSTQLRDYYYNKYKQIVDVADVIWTVVTSDTNLITGNLGRPVGTSSPGNMLRFVSSGALLKFQTTSGIKWTSVIKVSGNGTSSENGVGPIWLTDTIPNNSTLLSIIPAWKTALDINTITSLVDLINDSKPFGLRYDIETTKWKIIYSADLNKTDEFSLIHTGDTSRQHKDSSWLILFTTDTEYYTVKQRLLRYIFESDKQVRFYFDTSSKIYDTKNNTTIKDQIKILSINPQLVGQLSYDRNWEIIDQHIGTDGYIDSKKIQLSFSDSDDDGIVDNPELFEEYVDSNVSGSSVGYVVLEFNETDNDYRLSSLNDVEFVDVDIDSTEYANHPNQYYYNTTTKTIKYCTGTELILSRGRKVYQGAKDIKFQYIHNASNEARIDPGLTNIMDIYVLTKQYDTLYRQWVSGSITDKPLPPSSDSLYSLMAPKLNKIKSINDEIIYHPVKFKILFGQKASPELRATFKIVKNTELVASDNDIKSRVLIAINTFFNLENWDFGDKFYFSELQTYVMNQVSPYVVNFIIVPNMTQLSFGSLYEITAENDEIFINGATIDDIEIITAITANKIKSSGQIALENAGITNLTTLSARNN
jgi:hypothetical protein